MLVDTILMAVFIQELPLHVDIDAAVVINIFTRVVPFGVV